MAFMFGVREICDHPRSLCRGLDESILSVELLIIYVFAPVLLAWVLTRVRAARAETADTDA
jgi:hypothetical protein